MLTQIKTMLKVLITNYKNIKEKINNPNWFLPTGHPQDFQIAKLSKLVHRQ
tara:strand:- start:8785 stop:8937 length:153 start_codon:yes stop_codon:yes gene_type:complete